MTAYDAAEQATVAPFKVWYFTERGEEKHQKLRSGRSPGTHSNPELHNKKHQCSLLYRLFQFPQTRKYQKKASTNDNYNNNRC